MASVQVGNIAHSLTGKSDFVAWKIAIEVTFLVLDRSDATTLSAVNLNAIPDPLLA